MCGRQARMTLYSGLSKHRDAITPRAQNMDMPCMLSAQLPALLAAAASSAVISRPTLLRVTAISRSLYRWPAAHLVHGWYSHLPWNLDVFIPGNTGVKKGGNPGRPENGSPGMNFLSKTFARNILYVTVSRMHKILNTCIYTLVQ